MNETAENKENINFCNGLLKDFDFYLLIIFGVVGTLLNTSSGIFFYKIIHDSKNQNEDLFKYLFFKSCSATYLSVYLIFDKCEQTIFSELLKTYSFLIFRQIFFNYFVFVCELFSILMEVATIFNRYRTITKTNRIYILVNKLNINIVIIACFIYSCLFYIYIFIDEIVVENKVEIANQTRIIFTIKEKVLGEDSIILGYVHSSVRDGLCTLIIVIINILTLIQMKKINSNKQKLIRVNSIFSIKDKGNKAEQRLTVMVLLVTTIGLFSNGLTFIQYVFPEPIRSNECLQHASQITFWIANSINFFLYYIFNLNFKKYFNNFILKVYHKILNKKY